MRYRPFQPIAKVVSVSSMSIGSLAVFRQPCREPGGGVEQPSIAGFGREQDQLANADDTAVVVRCPALNIPHLISQAETAPLDDPLARSSPDRSSTPSRSRGDAMELFTRLFGDLLAFVYHCFDRIVIYGYLSGLSRPEQVVHFF